MTTIRDRGFSRASRRMACRLLLSPSLVTVQVFTTHKSAASPSAASRYPIRANPSRTSSVSYWLTLQPRVRVFNVAGTAAASQLFDLVLQVVGIRLSQAWNDPQDEQS